MNGVAAKNAKSTAQRDVVPITSPGRRKKTDENRAKAAERSKRRAVSPRRSRVYQKAIGASYHVLMSQSR